MNSKLANGNGNTFRTASRARSYRGIAAKVSAATGVDEGRVSRILRGLIKGGPSREAVVRSAARLVRAFEKKNGITVAQ